MTRLRIGPFFTGMSLHAPARRNEAPSLGVQIEWADEHVGAAIWLFRRRLKYAPKRLRFEDVIFPASEVPFDFACSEYQVVETRLGTFLPLDALLAALFTRYQLARSVFAILDELASLVPLEARANYSEDAGGFLMPEVESKGFKLQNVIRDGDRLYAEIGWRPCGRRYAFHTSICQFQYTADGRIHGGQWKPHGVIGVAQLLARELRRLVPGGPENLFSLQGWECLQKVGIEKPQLVTAE